MPFRKTAERTVYEGRVFDVVEASFEAPGGSEFQRAFVRHPGAVAVVALDGEGCAVVVRQYRPALGVELVEIPAGVRDVSGEDPVATARRELAEEAGYEAAHYRLLTEYYVAAGMSDERLWIYLATGLRECERDAHGPEEEAMTVERVPLDDVPRLIEAGELRDAKTIVGLLLARTVAA